MGTNIAHVLLHDPGMRKLFLPNVTVSLSNSLKPSLTSMLPHRVGQIFGFGKMPVCTQTQRRQ